MRKIQNRSDVHMMGRAGLTAALLATLVVTVVPAQAPAGEIPAVNLPGVDEAGRLETILARFDRAQASITTLEADFAELKELALFKEPISSQGRFFYATPHQAKWEYVEPDAKVFLITDNSLMQYFPAEKLLERRDLREANTNRLFKLFGMGQSSADLEDFYEISLGDGSSEDMPATYELILKPRRKMVEKRVARVRLWVGDQDFLPRAMRLEEADGDFTMWRFSNVLINTELATGVFDLDVPDDVEVHKGISLFSSSADDAP
jgi:outer membrane lipoprotein-sorting protein